MISISIVIPTLNERSNILLLIKKIIQVCKKEGLDFEIIIADDNSDDGTAQEVIKRYKNSKLVKVTLGLGERSLAKAIYRGIKKSKGEIIIGMDADFNHPPELIPQLVNSLSDVDIVIASRFVKDGGMPNIYRYYFTYLFNLFLIYFFDFPVHDNMSGFYAIRKKDLTNLPLEYIFKGYGEYHLRFIYIAKKKNLKIVEIPVKYGHRKYGSSKSNLVKMFFLYTAEVLKLRFTNKYQ